MEGTEWKKTEMMGLVKLDGLEGGHVALAETPMLTDRRPVWPFWWLWTSGREAISASPHIPCAGERSAGARPEFHGDNKYAPRSFKLHISSKACCVRSLRAILAVVLDLATA